jgi:RNase H-like domain found in reverse transcriptase
MPLHMQACIEQLLENIRDSVAIWLDDVAPHGATETEYLDALEEFFRRVQQARLKLHARKATLISETVMFCRRIISRDGVKYSPKSFQALLDMPAPTNASELHQYLGSASWMRSHIPAYAERVAPLQVLLREVIAEVGSSRKSTVKVSLQSRWRAEHQQAFEEMQKQLQKLPVVAHPDPEKVLCVFSEASDKYFSGVITQIPNGDLDLPVAEQHHQPLAFSSGAFKGASFGGEHLRKKATLWCKQS